MSSANTSTPNGRSDADSIDLFLSYNNSDREPVKSFREILQTSHVSTFFDRENLYPGLPWFDALQDALSKVSAVAVFVGKEGLGVWQKREMVLALDRQAKEEKLGHSFPVIPILLPNADLSVAPGFLLLNTFIDLRSSLNNPAALDTLVHAIKAGALSSPSQPPVALCPYRALRPFREEDALLFFGREAFAEGLLKKVLNHNLVAVVGSSGSGKSSVVQAGLLPHLRRALPPQPTWDVIIFTPGKRPFHNLAAALIPLLEVEASETERLVAAGRLGSSLAGGEVALEAAIDSALKKSQGTDRLLIIVDQFEELFTSTPETDREPFIKSLLQAEELLPITIVVTLRADFYSQAISISRHLSDLIQEGLINLGPMTNEELRRSIENPAKSVGLEFEPGLVPRIIDHVKEQPGNLPLLEFALTELWGRRNGRLLNGNAYDEIGGVQGAISRRAEEQFNKLSAEQQELALRLLTRLVRVAAANEEGTDTRQRVRMDQLDTSIRSVAQAFVTSRLLVVSRNEVTNEEIVEVAHEALIRSWDRLKNILIKDREFLLWRQRLNVNVSQWERTGRDEGGLLRGASLDEAKGFAKEREKDLNESEREFIGESQRLSELEKKKPRRLIATAALFAILIIVAAMVWMLYAGSDRYQINTIFSNAPELVPLSKPETNKKFLLTLVVAKGVNEALTVANQITDPYEQSIALAGVARALAQAGRLDEAKTVADEALAAANKITDPTDQSIALTAVAAALTQAGRLDEALTVANKITNPYERSRALAGVARALAQAGRLDEAKTVANEALAAADKIPDPGNQFRALTAVAAALAQAGRLDEALTVANKITDLTQQSIALADVARALAQAGRLDETIAAANKITDPTDRSHALADVARALAQAGRLDEAKTVANEALAAANKITNPTQQSIALAGVAAVLAQAGRLNEAKTVADEALAAADNITKPYDQSIALAAVARALTQAGRLDEALTAAIKITDPGNQYSALARVAAALTQAGRLNEAKTVADEAFAAANKFPDPYNQFRGLTAVAAALTQAGRLNEAKTVADEALTAANKITNATQQSSALANVAKVQAQFRSFKRAREIAERCHLPDDKLDAYSTILFEYTDVRDPNLLKLFKESE